LRNAPVRPIAQATTVTLVSSAHSCADKRGVNTPSACACRKDEQKDEAEQHRRVAAIEHGEQRVPLAGEGRRMQATCGKPISLALPCSRNK
jgi:hypothetical protein